MRRLADELALTGVSLIGHDIGAQIVYACLRTWPAGIRKAVLMNIVIPGIDPWLDVPYHDVTPAATTLPRCHYYLIFAADSCEQPSLN